MFPKLLVTSYYDRSTVQPELNRLAGRVDVQYASERRALNEDELLAYAPNCTFMIISDDRIGAKVLDHAPHLRLICCDGVGIDHLNLDLLTERGVMACHAPVLGETNGEFVIGLLLAVTRRIVASDRDVRRGLWSVRTRFVTNELAGRTLGLVGFGRVARATAKYAHAFGLDVIAYSPHADAAVAAELNVTIVSLDELLAQSDIVSLHVTLHDGTRGMIGAEQIARMKEGAVLINTSRGAVVDEPALLAALRSKWIIAAAFDVLTQEPPPRDHPFFELENVIVTPHMASDTYQAFTRVFARCVDQITSVLDGRQPSDLVNPKVLEHLKNRPQAFS